MVNWSRFKLTAEPRRLRFIRSWHRIGFLLTVLTGILAFNIAGCGGGGGGGAAGGGSSTVTVTFQLVDGNSTPSDGTVTITGQTFNSASTRAIVAGLAPGNYSVTFVINGVSTTASVTIGAAANQSFVLTQGTTTTGGTGVTVTGRVFLNNLPYSTSNCSQASSGVSAPLIVRVIDLNNAGTIVATSTKPSQSSEPSNAKGNYIISNVPGPGTYRVTVREQSGPSYFNGISPSFTVAAGQTLVTGIDICANPTDTAPPTP